MEMFAQTVEDHIEQSKIISQLAQQKDHSMYPKLQAVDSFENQRSQTQWKNGSRRTLWGLPLLSRQIQEILAEPGR
jgi:hypothetical protein